MVTKGFSQIKYLGLLLLIFSFNTLANVQRAQLTTAIENREPVDNLQADVTGPADTISNVYFFNQITDMANETIRHVWLYNNEPMANVELNIGSHNWRTYSSKRLKPEWQGNWKVEIWHGEQLLGSQEFTYRTY